MPLSYACIGNGAQIFCDAIVTLVLILIKTIGEDILNVLNTGSKLWEDTLYNFSLSDTRLERIYTGTLPECHVTPCPKQAWCLKIKWLQPLTQPLTSQTNTQSFGQFG